MFYVYTHILTCSMFVVVCLVVWGQTETNFEKWYELSAHVNQISMRSPDRKPQHSHCCLKPVFLRVAMLTQSEIWFYLQNKTELRAWIWTERADGRFTNVILHNKDRHCVSALLMAVCIRSHSWLWEIEMIYMHFSSIWGTIKHWCWYPSGNVDRIAFLPTVYLPAASSVGSMHQN